MCKETRKSTWFQSQCAGATGQFLLTHNCDSLLFSAGSWWSASSLWAMFLAEGLAKRQFSSWALARCTWSAYNNWRSTLGCDRSVVYKVTDIESSKKIFKRSSKKAQKEGKTVHFASYTVFSQQTSPQWTWWTLQKYDKLGITMCTILIRVPWSRTSIWNRWKEMCTNAHWQDC